MGSIDIIVNGTRLTEPQTTAFRVALNTFDSNLLLTGLGDDEIGKSITEGYLERIKEIRELVYGSKRVGGEGDV